MYSDNPAVVRIAHESRCTGQAKQIELRFPAIQDVATRRKFDLKYSQLEENCADTLTESVQPQAHAKSELLLNLAA